MSLRTRLASLTVVCIVVITGSLAYAAPLAYDGFADGGAAPGVGQYQTSPPSTDGKNNDSLYGQGPALVGLSFLRTAGTLPSCPGHKTS